MPCEQGVARATQTLRNVRSAWVKEQEVQIENGEISGYKVNMLVTFVLDDNAELDEGGGGGVGGATGGAARPAGQKRSRVESAARCRGRAVVAWNPWG